MDQKPKPGYLFFTPRAPNGKRLSHLRFRQHLRASEDKVPYPASKTIQDLDEQKAPSQLGATIAPTAQAGSSSGVWRVPHTSPQGYQVPQQPQQPQPSDYEKAHMWAQTVNPAKYPPSAEQMRQAAQSYRIEPKEEGLFGGHLRGSFGYGRDRPKSGPTEGTIEGGYYSNPGLQDQLEEEKLRDRPIDQPETGEPPEARMPAYNEKDEKAKKEMEKYPGFTGPGRLG